MRIPLAIAALVLIPAKPVRDAAIAGPPGSGELAACCVQDDCSVVTEADCDQVGGYWLHEQNTGRVTITDCNMGPCAIGSCCIGPGECQDSLTDGQCNWQFSCIDEFLCETITGDASNFVGGAFCDYPKHPCPVCEIAGLTNCSPPDLDTDFITWQMSDRSAPGGGVVSADDFVPSQTSLGQVCIWGAFLERNSQDPIVQQNGSDCSETVPECFRVQVYDDDNGRPGQLVGLAYAGADCTGGPIGSVRTGPAESVATTTAYPDMQLYVHQLTLSSTITQLTPGQRHWLEIAADHHVPGTCLWHWMHATNGNSYSAHGTLSGYPEGGQRSNPHADHAWCLDTSIDPVPPAPSGTCCPCDGSPCFNVALADCALATGTWNGTPGTPSNDDCVNALGVSSGAYATDTTCASTEPGIPADPNGFGADVWYTFTATCTGRVIVNMCATGNTDTTYNSIVGVYRNAADPYSLPACDGALVSLGSFNDMDEGCNSIADGGAGLIRPQTFPGMQYLVRVGGANGEAGRGLLTVGCSDLCTLSLPPGPEDLGSGIITKNRALSVEITQGTLRAVRVTFDDLAAPFDVASGMAMWLDEPVIVCEGSGQIGDGTGAGCTPKPPPTPTTTTVATLGCDPHYRDWSGDGIINVVGEFIIPESTYSVQVIGEDCLIIEDAFSDPLVITTPMYGDVMGLCGTPPCLPPDNSVDIGTDVTGVLDKFKNLANAPRKMRADGEPAILDYQINISDVVFVLDAFRSDPYPFSPPALPCPP